MSPEPDTLEAEIEGLLALAREGDEAQVRLLRIRDKVRRGVLLGPRTRAYLNKLHAMIEIIECRWLGRVGECRERIGAPPACPHLEDYRACAHYAPVRTGQRGSPLAMEVIHHAR